MMQLRDRLNEAACDMVYSDAAAEFRGRLYGDDWRRGCEQLKPRFGPWENLGIRSTHVWRYVLAFADGTSTFSGEAGRFLVTWRLGNGRARLVAFSLESGGQSVAFPEGGLRFIDPPMRRLPPAKPSGESRQAGDLPHARTVMLDGSSAQGRQPVVRLEILRWNFLGLHGVETKRLGIGRGKRLQVEGVHVETSN